MVAFLHQDCLKYALFPQLIVSQHLLGGAFVVNDESAFIGPRCGVEGSKVMFSKLSSAVLRSVFVVLLIATPSLFISSTPPDTLLIVSFIAFCAAVFTFSEYTSTSPSLVEFRDAAPFNRVRFFALMLTVFSLTMIQRGFSEPTAVTNAFAAIGSSIGQNIDFPFSPVRLMVLMLPANSSPALVEQVQSAAGLSYVVSLLSLLIFIVVLRLSGWPTQKRDFNLWVNLPTFDPTVGGDVVKRLNRDGFINLVLGFLLPFIIPALVKLTSDVFNPVSLADSHTLIWTMSAWAFLPASLMMRGVAMTRVAQMIESQRQSGSETEDRSLYSLA